MKITEKRNIIILIITLIPALAFAIYSSIFVISEYENFDIDFFVFVFETDFFVLANFVSIILIRKHNIDYVKTYVRTILTDLLLLFIIIPIVWIWIAGVELEIWSKEIIIAVIIIYPIACVLATANKVRRTLKELAEPETGKPKLLHTLAITFINPLLPFLPFLMEIAYLIVTFDGLGL